MSIKNVDLNILMEQLTNRDLISSLNEWNNACLRENIKLYLVGGCIRDSILGIKNSKLDLDFIVDPFEKTVFATKELNKILGYHSFPLDIERNIYRLSFENTQVDVNGIRGEELIDDIFDRDFTINSLTISLTSFLRHAKISDTFFPINDYFNGIEDLKIKQIKIHNPDSFINDPLRILRAIRIASQINGKIDPFTFQKMSDSSSLMKNVSTERIRDEFLKILSNSDSFKWIGSLEESGILSSFFPFFDWYKPLDSSYTTWMNLRNHIRSALWYTEKIFKEIHKGKFPHCAELCEILNTNLVPEATQETLMKIAILLHDVGKPDTIRIVDNRLRFFEHENVGVRIAQEYLSELHFSSKEIQFITSIIKWHMRPHNLSNSQNLTNRAKYRYFKDTGKIGIPNLLIALADAYATRLVPMGGLPEYENFVDEMITFALTPGSIIEKPFLNGNEIMNILSIKPSKSIGRILKDLLEEQSIGNVTSRDEAKKWLLKYVDKKLIFK
ncbi:MAG: HD domain-containing protein [Caldisericia bacterium]|nr:HD domain-containing protein [Caldisericia bacterium]